MVEVGGATGEGVVQVLDCGRAPERKGGVCLGEGVV